MNKRFRGEKGIRNGRVTIVENNGQYVITIFKRRWFKEKEIVRMVIDDFDTALKTFNAIF